MDRQALNVAPVEMDRSAIGAIQARYEMEERCLAGAIGPDQRVDFTGLNRETRTRYSADAAEMLRDVDNLEHLAGLDLRAEKCRKRQSLIDLALAHRCVFFRWTTPASLQLGPDANQPAGREQHKTAEDEAEPQQPIGGPD